MKKRVHLTIGIVLSLLFCWYAFSGVDFSIIKEILGQGDYQRLFYYLIWMILSFVFRGLRSKQMGDHLDKLSFATHFNITAISYMLNNFFPARLGDVSKAYLLSKKSRITVGSGLAIVVLERLFDLITLTAITAVALLAFGTGGTLQKYSYIFLVFLSFIMLFLYLFRFKSALIEFWIEKIFGRISSKLAEKIVEMIKVFAQGLAVLESFKDLLITFIYSIGVWISILGLTYECGQILKMSMSFVQAIYPVAFIGIGMLIPAAPGFIGTFHTFCIKGLEALGFMDKDLNAGYAILAHGANYISLSILGIICFLKEQFSFKTLSGEIENVVETELEKHNDR